MIQDRMAGAVLFDKMELDIIIGSVYLRMDLIPNAFFHESLFVRTDQVTEAVTGIGEEFIHILTACIPDQLLIGIQNAVILGVCLVDQKCTGKVLGNIP